MKTIIITVISCLCILATSATAGEEVLYAANCPATASAPVIDGDLKDDCWNSAGLIDDFGKLFSGSKPRYLPPSYVKLMYDAKHLYVGCYFEEREMAAMKEKVYNKLIAVHWRDCVEVFIDPEHGRYRFYKLFSNPIDEYAGYKHWEDGWGPYTDRLWAKTAGVVSKARIHEKSWQVEIAVPWASLKHQPRDGMVIGFNVNRFRFRGQGERPFYTWSARGGASNNNARFFGHVILGSLPESTSELVSTCVPDYAEKQIIVPMSDRLAVFDKGSRKERTFAELKRSAVKWLEERNAEVAGLISAEQKKLKSFAPIARVQQQLVAEITKERELYAESEMDAGLGIDFSRLQFALRAKISEFSNKVKVATLIADVRAKQGR